MRRPHPCLERAEDVFHGLPAKFHGVRHSIQPILHGLQNRFMFPARDTPVVARGAARFQRAARTGRGPVAVLRQAALKARHAIDRVLPGRAAVGVALGEVDEIGYIQNPKATGDERPGLSQFRIFRGRLFSNVCTRLISRRDTRLNRVPAGKNCRKSPLVFSLVPRSQREWGCAK